MLYCTKRTQILLSLGLLLFEDAMSCQQLRNHEMRNVFIGPVRKMACDTSKKGDIESLSLSSAVGLSIEKAETYTLLDAVIHPSIAVQCPNFLLLLL